MSHKNLILFFALALFLTGSVFAGFTLINAGNDSFTQPLTPEADTIQIKTYEGAKVDFVFQSTNQLQVEVKDESGDRKIRKPRFFKMNGNLMTIEFSEEWKDKVERVIVPEGVLLEIVSSKPVTVAVSDRKGSRSTGGSSHSVLIDTSQLSSLSFDGDEIIAQGWGDVDVFEDAFEETEENGSDAEEENEENTPVFCGQGIQAVRNYCCVIKNNNQPGGECSNGGAWVFDNDFLECQYQCAPEEGTDCGVGAQAVRDLCCAQENVDSLHSSCEGAWVYNNSNQACAYDCYDDYWNGEDDNDEGQQQGEVSQFCSSGTSSEERDLCCDDAFKNPLSMGPRVGFPDCIGKWHFASDTGCYFACANYSEQRQIIKELRENAQ